VVCLVLLAGERGSLRDSDRDYDEIPVVVRQAILASVHLHHPLMAHRLALAGVTLDLRAINRDVPKFHQSRLYIFVNRPLDLSR